MVSDSKFLRQVTEPEIDAQGIFLRALSGCSVEFALGQKLRIAGGPEPFARPFNEGIEVDLRGVRRLMIIAMGKGATSMLEALLRRADVVAGREICGVLVAPQKLDPMPKGFTYFEGAHPYPNESSFRAAHSILGLLDREQRSTDTFCFFLVSGGASAMVELPLDTSIGLEDTIAFHRELVHSGASIAEMNCVRKHFSAVKGGRMGMHALPLRRLTIMSSDVPAQQSDTLASGPTLPDRSTIAECRSILTKYQLGPRLPVSVVQFFSSGTLQETPKPGDFSAQSLLLLSSVDLAKQAQAVAESLGYAAFIDNRCDDWDYRDASHFLLERSRVLRNEHSRVCLISVGEVSVQVRVRTELDDAGSSHRAASPKGGRNQHFVLFCATQMQERDRGLAVLSCGSDGIDGNSPAAGAVMSMDARGTADSNGWRRAAEDALRSFSSFDFLQSAGCTIHTGPTGTNLRDLRILIASQPPHGCSSVSSASGQ